MGTELREPARSPHADPGLQLPWPNRCSGLLFKSEAIVHPDEVVKYISPRECQISYNPTLMALLWESLATRKVAAAANTAHRFRLPQNTAWVNYLRCHDDIGWTFDDADASAIGINAYDHRQFLNDFYTGQFPGSFARGVPFQENRTRATCGSRERWPRWPAWSKRSKRKMRRRRSWRFGE
jgi:hypothetical protein